MEAIHASRLGKGKNTHLKTARMMSQWMFIFLPFFFSASKYSIRNCCCFVRDDPRAFSNKRRWIPPSSLRRDALWQENGNDVIFRKVSHRLFSIINPLQASSGVVVAMLTVSTISSTYTRTIPVKGKSIWIEFKLGFFWFYLTSCVLFFQVQGILNKLTPEKFEKLSDDILAVGLSSKEILKGVILLVRLK